MASLAQSEMAVGGRDIAPYETTACERLTEQIRCTSLPGPAPPPTTTFGSRTLEEALKEAAITIRFNAKWFALAPLAALLDAALDAASSSSASADLNAAVGLIETIATYSHLPPKSLLQTIKFLSQTYYNASRANKTRKLADYVWKTLQHLLGSHLGGQCVTSLMEITNCQDDVYLESRVGYAVVAGALMIISEKLVLKKDVQGAIPTLDLSQLLDSLWGTAVHGDDYLREFIMDIVVRVLEDESAVQEIDDQASWEVLLDTVEPCVAMTPTCRAAFAVVNGLTNHTNQFELRKRITIAGLVIDVNQPLTETLSSAFLESWSKLTPSGDWPRGFDDMMKKLVASSNYIREIRRLVDWAVEVFELADPPIALPDFAKDLEAYVHAAAGKKESIEELVEGIIKLFVCKIKSKAITTEPQCIELSEVLCGMAPRSIGATRFLFHILADADEAVYLETTSHQVPPSEVAQYSMLDFLDYPDLLLKQWEAVILSVLGKTEHDDWEIYWYFLDHLPALLGNHTMFEHRIDEFIPAIGKLICEQLDAGKYPEPPAGSEYTKSGLVVRLIRVITSVQSYHRHLTKQSNQTIAWAILHAAGSRDYSVSIPCIHALTICSYEIPEIMTSAMDDVIDKMSKMVTQRYLAIHVLVFLAGMSRLPQLFHNFQIHEYKKIFGVCGSYLQSIRGTNLLSDRQQTPSSDQSGRVNGETVDALPQYVYALAHHVIAFWYLALKPEHRLGLRSFIAGFLRYKGTDGQEILEDQGLVTLDFMDRVDAEGNNANLNLKHDPSDGRTVTRQRLAGVLLVTTETALRTEKTIVTIRRPTGTTRHIVHGIDPTTQQFENSLTVTSDTTDSDFIDILPYDLTGKSGRIYVPPLASPLGSSDILTLPEEDAVRRAIESFDRTPALDSHKAGVIYIGEDQTNEDEIFQNVQGSPDYVAFVQNLGTLRRLRDAKFNTQGLDRASDADGQHAIVWNNDVTELVFHITTLMPNNEDVSLNTANKKRHVGNDFVNIVFNNSGRPFDMNTFPSQFSAVYIVIAPSARTSFLQTRLLSSRDDRDRFYRVHVVTRPGYPAISSAAEEKVISGASLPGYVRNLALNDCVFSQMWHQGESGGEYASSWRSRLEQLRRLRERYSG